MSDRLRKCHRAAWIGAIAVLASHAVAAHAAEFDPQQVDATVRPGDDFHAYANGAWLKGVALPPGRSRYDTTSMLRDRNAARIQALVEQAARAPASPREKRVGDFYASWMDAAGVEARGLQPLAGDLAAIAALRDSHGLSAWLGHALRLDDGTNTQTDGLLGVWFHQGFHDGDHYVPHLVQGGLGLADRDDYLDPARSGERDLYRAHIAAILKLAGFDQADVRAGRVLDLETAIARSHAPTADLADVFTTDHPWRRADFAAQAPGMDWAAWFKAAGLDRQDQFNVWQPSAVAGAARLVADQPIAAWKDYLAFHLVEHYAAALPRAVGEEDAAFRARLSSQPPAAPDRTQQAIAATTAALGEDIGQLYVARYFPPQAKAAAETMVRNLRTAFRVHLERLTWMAPATRDLALGKLDTLKVGVGYPDTWIDYSGLKVLRDDALGNMRRGEAFAYRQERDKLARPVDPDEWIGLLPQQPGAVINFSPNSEQFAAGLLQPPFFDPDGDLAANYGSAGAGMAHELGHTFDELGAIYDAQGRLVRWWTAEDKARYQAAAAPLAAQLQSYCPKPDLCLKVPLVLGEAISDLGGLSVAYDAYQLALNGRPDTVRDGLTGDQRFFLAFARRWRRLQTDAALRQQVATDAHAPGEYRTDSVRNLEAWRRAFDVKPGDRLYLGPQDSARIW